MLKKSMLVIAFIISAVVVTGCNAAKDNTADTANQDQAAKVEKTDKAKKVDPKKGLFIKIDPKFDATKIPAAKEKITWFKDGIASKVPAVPEGNIVESVNNDKECVVYIANVDGNMYNQYHQILEKAGYTYGKASEYPMDVCFDMNNDTYAINTRLDQEGQGIMTVRIRLISDDEKAKFKNGEPI